MQQSFDNTGFWRQARVDLSSFAGMENLQLRVEYSTGGTALSSSDALRTVSGKILANTVDREFIVEGSQITADAETFVMQLAPVVTVPSGSELAELYTDPAEVALITIDGQEYLLNDGTRTPTAPQIDIDLLAGTEPGTTLGDLNATQVASGLPLPSMPICQPIRLFQALNFGSEDVPPAVGRNDFPEATSLPYERNHNSGFRPAWYTERSNPPTNVDDVDLLRLNVRAGTVVAVDLDLLADDLAQTPLDSVIRFFDSEGNELSGLPNPAEDTVELTAPADGLIYIGFSGVGNSSYDPRIELSAQVVRWVLTMQRSA